MSLLVDMSSTALDPGYEEAARRNPESEGRHGRRSPAILLALTLIGLSTGVVAVQTRRDADKASSVRRALVTDVQDRTRATDALSAQATTLRAEVSLVRRDALSKNAAGRALAAQVALLELVTAEMPVRGPGIVVVLEDAVSAERSASGDGRIFDRDIQDVVNALWAAGAEAISINGQRFTSLTAIRSAGDAVLVDLRPLASPYRVSAVGRVDTLEPAFVDSATARRFKTWTSLYGLGFRVTREEDLRLPAGADPVLRHAVPASDEPADEPADDPAPGPGGSS
jgi:uncharacterized protein YlxW (UPF0749 family)